MARYKPTIGTTICERLARGESLTDICGPKRAKDMPSQTTFYRWLKERPRFAAQFAVAREAQADFFMDDILKIADGKGEDPEPTRDKIKIDARKWVAAKLSPRRYGDKAVAAEPAPAPAPRFADDQARAARIVAILAEAGLKVQPIDG